jgi:PIN domain nuclease of toxin-antitoxin system
VTVVVDASALLALLFDEPGAEDTAEAIADGATVSTVNLAEVATVLTRNRRDPQTILNRVCAQVTLQPFTEADALAVAALYPKTSPKGLSLGDRACLALAERLHATALTAEHAWVDLSLGVPVRLIRHRH